MWIRSLKCSLVAVVIFACVFLTGSGGVSAGAYNGAGASALSGTSTLEDIPGAHDRHKGIRSYSTDFPHDNSADRGVKSYGTPSRYGASHDQGTKDGGHGYNKNADGCSKCKWENDDYWERDEPEEEGDENDEDECDDGQYRPDKPHHHSPGRGHKGSGSRPSGVHKTGPTGVYIDDGVNKGGPLGINYPTGYTRPVSGYETTPKSAFSWNTPFADTSKPGYSDVTASAFGTTPSSWPYWNRGTTQSGSGPPPKSAWGDGHDGRFPSSQEPGASVPNFGSTSRPGQGWNQFPSSSSPAVSHTGSDISSPSSYGNPQENQNKPYGQPGTQNVYAGAYAGTSVTSGSYGGPSNFGRKDHPFGLYKPVNTQTPHQLQTDQAPSNTDNEYYGLGGYNKPGPGFPSIRPATVTNTFGTTKGPYGGIDSSRTVPGTRENPYAPGRSPESPSGSSIYVHPSVTKPSYSGSTTSWLGAGQTVSPWHGRTTPHVGSPTLNTGFGTTKTPFSHVNIPSSTLSPPYDRTRPKQPGFNVASAIASASASAFGTSPGAYSTPSIIGTTSFYDTTPAHRGGSSYTPGVKGSIGNTRPVYGTAPHGTYPNPNKSGTWPGKQSGSSVRPWSSGKPEDGIMPDRYSPSGILPDKQPQGGSGTWSTGQPTSGSGAWSSKQPGDGIGTWPGQVQPGHESRPECPGGNCRDAGPREGTHCGGCCGNYNCDGGCSVERGNVPATHGLCDGATGSSGVNKTYYPAGTGDGNIPNIGTVYGPDSSGAIYPGTQGASVTPGSPVRWNSANPFLYQAGDSTPDSFSRPWTYTTDKPIGKGNLFLDSSWSTPKPGYNNAYNDRNVIPHGEENTKPIGQGNLFLDGSNKRGNIDANPNEVIPLEKKIPEGNNPFLRPLVDGSSDSGNPSYGKHPDTSKTPGDYPGSGIPTSFPKSGNYPESRTPGNYPGSGIPTSFPKSGNYPESRTPENYPGSRTPGNYRESRIPGNYPGSKTLIETPGSGTPGNYPRPGTSGSALGSGIPGNYPGSGISGSEGVKGGFHSGGTPFQDGNSDRSYSPKGSNPQGAGPLECKLGLFGCGTPGSGSYADKHPGGAFSTGISTGNVGVGTGNLGNVPGAPRAGLVSGTGPGSEGSNLAASVGGAQARAYAGSYSSAQAASSSFASSFSGASGSANNFSGNLSPGVQNQGGPNSWSSNGASAFASSSAGSWSGNHPINVKG